MGLWLLGEWRTRKERDMQSSGRVSTGDHHMPGGGAFYGGGSKRRCASNMGGGLLLAVCRVYALKSQNSNQCRGARRHAHAAASRSLRAAPSMGVSPLIATAIVLSWVCWKRISLQFTSLPFLISLPLFNVHVVCGVGRAHDAPACSGTPVT